MDRYTKSQQAKQFNRNSDISIGSKNRQRIEALMTAHYAAGNTDAFMLGANALSKFDSQNDLSQAMNLLATVVAKFDAKLGDGE